jgi:uncharacterized protein (TIGR00290 family)
MTDKIPVILAWSGGKDSAYALHQLVKDKKYDVVYLLSTINGNNGRLSMHGIREELMEAQAAAIGIPLLKVYVYEGNNMEYEKQMKEVLLKVKADGIYTVAFGDIFLEDLRIYRENQLKQVGMECLFPLWKRDTLQLVHQFIDEGFKAYTCCINDEYLDEGFCGRLVDREFVKELPAPVDPCGENGEFHSFCFDGPVFGEALSVSTGKKIYKSVPSDSGNRQEPDMAGTLGFWYCDLELQQNK